MVQALSSAALWPSGDHEAYFRRTARALCVEFLEEASQALGRLAGGGGGSDVRRVALSAGRMPGEFTCQGASGRAPGGGRGLLPSDSVLLSPEAGFPADRSPCECEVVVSEPLVIRALHKEHALVKAVASGQLAGAPFRVEKLANRTGFTRMLCAVHCLAEPPRQGLAYSMT